MTGAGWPGLSTPDNLTGRREGCFRQDMSSFMGNGAGAPRDVDALRFRGKRGEQVTIRAERFGRGRGRQVALSLTGPGLTPIRRTGPLPDGIKVRLPRAGLYRIRIGNHTPRGRSIRLTYDAETQ